MKNLKNLKSSHFFRMQIHTIICRNIQYNLNTCILFYLMVRRRISKCQIKNGILFKIMHGLWTTPNQRSTYLLPPHFDYFQSTKIMNLIVPTCTVYNFILFSFDILQLPHNEDLPVTAFCRISRNFQEKLFNSASADII